MTITPAQVKEARRLLRWSQTGLAVSSGIGLTRVGYFERGKQIPDAHVARIRSALEAAGVEFISQNGEGPGARLRRVAD